MDYTNNPDRDIVSRDRDILRLINEIKESVIQEKSLLFEIREVYGAKKSGERKMISKENRDLKEELKKLHLKIDNLLANLIVSEIFFQRTLKSIKIKGFKLDKLEEKSLKELKKRIKIKAKKQKAIRENDYAVLANKIFTESPKRLMRKYQFNSLKKDLERANLGYTLPGYLSIIMFTTLLAFIAGAVFFVFFLFFKIEPAFPIIHLAEDIGQRILKLIWIPIVFPLVGFIIAYSYPSMERTSAETKIEYELPFVTINMAAIAGSMVNPVHIFEIIISSQEFPNIEKEFREVINGINIYGQDLVSSLKNTANNSASKKLAELFSGMAITINSGGDLANFLDKRAESLLFEYGLKKDKQTKMAATFMDMYISIVIAAPMIFLLLLMVMKISGLGVSLPISTISLIMILGVTLLNVFFLIFLQMKKSG